MKRLLAAALAAIASFAFGATTVPPSLINPAGSTAGQAILSTGPSGAPVWGAVTLTGITGTLAITNGGTGATSASAARTALGAASTGANTFTGDQTISEGAPIFRVDDSSGSSSANIRLSSGGSVVWGIAKTNGATGNFQIQRYLSGSLSDAPLSISNSTGVATFTQRPVFGSATPWDSSNLAVGSSMTGYSPTLSATSGTFTTASAAGRYLQIGKLTFFEVTVTITTVGSATGGVVVTLPFTINTGSGVVVFAGRENGVSGKMLQAYGSSNTVTIVNYDGTSPIAAGASPVISGVYISN